MRLQKRRYLVLVVLLLVVVTPIFASFAVAAPDSATGTCAAEAPPPIAGPPEGTPPEHEPLGGGSVGWVGSGGEREPGPCGPLSITP